MDIIPVIDLLDGHVVHARRGDRSNYRPIHSILRNGSEPLSIIDGLLELYPFKQIYIADINAIQKRCSHERLILEIKDKHPDLKIWLDAAIQNLVTVQSWNQNGIFCVIGSESLTSIETYDAIARSLKHRFALSLDFMRGHFLGPQTLLQNPDLWPQDVIAMNLDRVGSEQGPDIQLLASLISKSASVYAAGGVRHQADLQSLADIGVKGTLVASAIHLGHIQKEQIKAILDA
jgi:phosphoribosylformimino-5-aminoimidazole carboxamide ribotide isomerase